MTDEPKPMPSAEYIKACERLEMDNSGIADALGFNVKQPQRWAVDEPSAPPLVAGVIRLMLAGIIKPRQLWQAVRGHKISRR